MKTSIFVTIASGIALPIAAAATCADPGAYDSQGRYSCNPAHQYPNGQSCKDIDGCPLLVDANGQAIVEASATTSSAGSTETAACAGPGEYDSQGRYSCNPAHQYPNGQSCKDIEGCPLLVDANGKAIVEASATTSAVKPTETAACAGPGEYDSQGRYSCNPAHQYPDGQACKEVDGCPLLVDANGQCIVKATTTPALKTSNGTMTGELPVPTAGSVALQGGMAIVLAAAAFAVVF